MLTGRIITAVMVTSEIKVNRNIINRNGLEGTANTCFAERESVIVFSETQHADLLFGFYERIKLGCFGRLYSPFAVFFFVSV